MISRKGNGGVTVHEFPFSGAIEAQACIGEFLGESGIVEGADDGAAGMGAFVFQQRKNFPRQFAVEAGNRFIGQQAFGATDQGAGDGDALAFTAGDFVDRRLGEMGEAEAREKLGCL